MTVMTQHPAVCTICCKRAATRNPNETICDFAVDIAYALIGVCHVAMHFLLLPAGLLLAVIPAVITKRRRLNRKALQKLQLLQIQKRHAHEIQQVLHSEINTSLQALAYNDKLLDETERLLRELPEGYDARQLRRRLDEIDCVQQQHNDLINENMFLIEETKRLWEHAERQRLETEYPRVHY